MDNFLTRDQIQEIIGAMTARDIFAAMPTAGEAVAGPEIAGKTFENAAERQGHGALALDRVRPGDATYLGNLLGEVFADGPKDASTEPLPDSSGIGE